ncbi:MAG: hypothetical protein MHM6MM_002498 [Cercozoa sp. M6MM]
MTPVSRVSLSLPSPINVAAAHLDEDEHVAVRGSCAARRRSLMPSWVSKKSPHQGHSSTKELEHQQHGDVDVCSKPTETTHNPLTQ